MTTTENDPLAGAGDPVGGVTLPSKNDDTSSDEDLKKTGKGERQVLSHQADDYPMRVLSIPLMGNVVYLNPCTTVFGFAFLWGFSIWCMADPDGANARLSEWKASVTEKFTWFYISANPAFTFFVFWLAYRYGDVKLGKKDEQPEFDTLAYFMMLFSAGVAVGLFFYGVSEPLWHRNDNWFSETGYRAQDEIDQWALMLTLYHWGFAGWSPYIVVAVAAGIASYRFDLPMTVRSTLYQLLGQYTWGWIGDVVDGFSIVMTVAGVCTSLGLGSMQIVVGADRLGWLNLEDLDEDDETNKQVLVIWVITAVATASVVSGLSVGIKLLSQIGFGLGMILLILCLIMEKTNYIFNVTVQTVGYYFQKCLFMVPFWTDAFGQLTESEGRAVDGNSANSQWMNWWTVFYMAWWTAWGAFVGLFIARISRGRTIREVTLYSFVTPLIYSFMWFGTFGGIGLRQARQAEELQSIGEVAFQDPAYYQVPGNEFCYDVPQETVVVDGEVVFENKLPGVTPVCVLDPDDAPNAWFNVMFSFSFKEPGFNGFGGFMAGLSLVALTIYFVTSSDSGSLIVDHLASNGHEDHHWAQRVFWAFTEGAVATALLVAGGSDALSALQAASIVFGLPFNLFLFCMMYSTVKMCHISETQDKEGNHSGKLPVPEDTSFHMHLMGGIANVVEFCASLGRVHEERVARGMDKPTMFQVVEFFTGLFLPFYSMYRVLVALDYKPKPKYAMTGVYFSLYVMWIVLFGFTSENVGYKAFGFVCFFMNAVILTVVRMDVRTRYKLDGNIVADFVACSWLYPQALCQMMVEIDMQSEGNISAQEEEVEDLVEYAVEAPDTTAEHVAKEDNVAEHESDVGC